MGTILRALLTVLLVGVPTGFAAYRVVDRTNPGRATENGAVVEPVFSSTPSPSPEITEEPQETVRRTRTAAPQQTEQPGVIIIGTPHPTETAVQDHDEETEEPSHDPQETDGDGT